MKVLITGLGSIGERHAKLLSQREEAIELIAYRSEYSESQDSLDIREFTDLDEALKLNPDIAFITNPTFLHVETALKCARAGCNLFVEKPLSHSLTGVDELIREADSRGLITMVGCQLRFDPVLNRVHELVNSERFGQALSFRIYSGSYLPDWRPQQDYRKSYSADPNKGGGVVLDLIHELDYLHWIFDKPSQIQSEITHVDSLEIDSEAIAEIVVRTKQDIVGNVHLSYCRKQPRREIEVVCEDGTVIGDLANRTLTLEKESGKDVENFDYGRNRRFKKQLDYFLSNVKSADVCENDLIEGKEVLETALEVKSNANDE